MNVASIDVGFIDIPGMTTLNIYCCGCSLCCPDCQNPSLQDFNPEGSYPITIHLLREKLKSSLGLCEAVCWLGGEPTEHPEMMRDLILEHQKIPHVIFSGRTRQEILDNRMTFDLFDIADAVKVGRWEGKPLGLPGSNQKIYVKHKEIEYLQLATVLRGNAHVGTP